MRMLTIGFLLLMTPISLLAQGNVTCGVALSQLQSYVQGVNAFANAEYYQNIPARCAVATPFGFQVHPVCAQTWLQQLNAWYMQQSVLVNQWYTQINQQCTANPSTTRRIPASKSSEAPRLDEKTLDQVKIDDEDKSVRIKIPSTPGGYKGAYR